MTLVEFLGVGGSVASIVGLAVTRSVAWTVRDDDAIRSRVSDLLPLLDEWIERLELELTGMEWGNDDS